MAHAGEIAQLAIGGASSKALTFAAGELVGRARSHEPEALIEAAAAYDDFAHAKRYWPKPRREKPGPGETDAG